MTAAAFDLNRLRPSRPLQSLGWMAAGVLCGFLVATQPLAVVIICLAILAALILVGITPIAAGVALLILAPLRTLIATEASVQFPLDIGQILLLVVVAAWAAQRIAHGKGLLRHRWSPVAGEILFFIGVISLTIFSATSLSAWLNEWLKWVQILVLIVLTLDMGRRGRWEWLVFGLVMAGVANALIGLYQFFGGSGALHLLINDRFFRAFGTFGQPNPFGGFMGLLTPLALMSAWGYTQRALRQWRRTRRIARACLLEAGFYGLAAGILGIGIGISWSRGAWLGFAAAVVVMAIALPRRTWRGLLTAGGIAGLLLLGWAAGILPTSVTERISSSTQELFAFEDARGVDITPENYAVMERLAHWQAALNMAAHQPWLGVGMGGYEVVYPQFRLINWVEPLGHAHNYYLNILAEAGIIGLLGYGKVWLAIIWMTWRVRRHPDNLARSVVVGLLGTWAYLSIHHVFDNLYVNNLFLHLGMMLGVLAVLHNELHLSKRPTAI